MNYDDHDDFYEGQYEDGWDTDDYYDDSMDGDHESGFASAGWGVDESYHHDVDDYENYYGEDY